MSNQFFKIVGCAVLIVGFSALPSWAQGEEGGPPGTVNYVEGEAWIGSTQLTSKSVRSTVLLRGETLTTKTYGRSNVLTSRHRVRLLQMGVVSAKDDVVPRGNLVSTQ